jgi:multiple antibiotic resistance protein
MDALHDLVNTFVFLIAVIDPVGSVPVFLAVTRGYGHREKWLVAVRATIIAATILIFFIFVGEFLLDAINVPLSAFQIAGGIVLFLFALTMIFGESKPDEEVKMVGSAKDMAVFPMAVPSIASPGAMMAVVILTKNERYTLMDQLATTVVMLVVLLITFGLLVLARFVHRWIGDSGASIISRVMGLILASVAVEAVLEGITIYFHL